MGYIRFEERMLIIEDTMRRKSFGDGTLTLSRITEIGGDF